MEDASLSASSAVAVVGGGVAGMLQALLLAEAGSRVTLVERSEALGGLFTSIQSPFGPLDRGIHILYESGIEQFDRLFQGALPPDEWIVLGGQRKDIGGNYFRGHLNQGSIFPDIRNLEPLKYERALGSFFSRLPEHVPSFHESRSLAEYFERRFGPILCQDVFEPISKKIWKHDAPSMSAWAARIVHMTRLVMVDERLSLELKSLPLLDQLVAYPDQLRLPDGFLSNRLRAFYPKRFGLSYFVSALSSKLEEAGVQLAPGTQVTGLVTRENRIHALATTDAGGRREIEASAVVWSSPIDPLAQLLNVQVRPAPDSPLLSRTAFLFLTQPPNMGELYYFYCFDPEFSVFRVSNFAAFCPSAAAAHGHPVGLELHFDAGQRPSDQEVATEAVRQALELGLVASSEIIRHVHVQPAGGFFIPTLANIAAAAESYAAVEARLPENLVLTTQNPANGAFYLHDALRSAYDKLSAWIDG